MEVYHEFKFIVSMLCVMWLVTGIAVAFNCVAAQLRAMREGSRPTHAHMASDFGLIEKNPEGFHFGNNFCVSFSTSPTQWVQRAKWARLTARERQHSHKKAVRVSGLSKEAPNGNTEWA